MTRPERVQAAFEVYDGVKNTIGPNGAALFAYIKDLEAENERLRKENAEFIGEMAELTKELNSIEVNAVLKGGDA